MPVILFIFICVAAIWYFLEWEPEPSQNSASQVQKQSADLQSFFNLPNRPELSASIAEQADYVVESCAYWCGQLAQALESDSATRARALTEDLPIYLSAHRSTLDLCYAKIIASEATIAERFNDSPGVQRKRMAAINSVKRELEAVEAYLVKCDILWEEVSVPFSGSQSSTGNERTQNWVSQLRNLMEAATTMLH